VPEAPVRLHQPVERLLAAVPERRMADVVAQRQCLAERLVQEERGPDAARGLGDLAACLLYTSPIPRDRLIYLVCRLLLEKKKGITLWG